MKYKLSIIGLLTIMLVSLFSCQEKKVLGSCFIENKSNYSIKITYKKTQSDFIKIINLNPNEKHEEPYDAGEPEIGNVIFPFTSDTIFVEFNDSTFIDTPDLKRSIIISSDYNRECINVKVNETIYNDIFTIDNEYINILRKQIKRK